MAEPGSIPAWAGEPPHPAGNHEEALVYPRVGGGTPCGSRGAWICRGLSPRGRGNRLIHIGRGHRVGSIPAWAGEPAGMPGLPLLRRVYPRVGGGTRSPCRPRRRRRGLSPRGRGNLVWGVAEGGQLGSIPAWAGEP